MTILWTALHFKPRIPLTCAFSLGIRHSAMLSNVELFARDLMPTLRKMEGSASADPREPLKNSSPSLGGCTSCALIIERCRSGAS